MAWRNFESWQRRLAVTNSDPNPRRDALLIGYLEDDLPAAEQRALDAALGANRSLREELHALAEIDEALSDLAHDAWTESGLEGERLLPPGRPLARVRVYKPPRPGDLAEAGEQAWADSGLAGVRLLAPGEQPAPFSTGPAAPRRKTAPVPLHHRPLVMIAVLLLVLAAGVALGWLLSGH